MIRRILGFNIHSPKKLEEPASSKECSIFSPKNLLLTALGLTAIGSFGLFLREKSLQAQMNQAFDKLDCGLVNQTYSNMLLPSGLLSPPWNTMPLECETLRHGAQSLSLKQFCELDTESQCQKVERFSLQRILKSFDYCKTHEELNTVKIPLIDERVSYFDSLNIYDLKNDAHSRWKLLSEESLKNIKMGELADSPIEEIEIISDRLSKIGKIDELVNSKYDENLSIFEFYYLPVKEISHAFERIPIHLITLLDPYKITEVLKTLPIDQLNHLLPRLSSKVLSRVFWSTVKKLELSTLSESQLVALLGTPPASLSLKIECLPIESLNEILFRLSPEFLKDVLKSIMPSHIQRLDLSKLSENQLKALCDHQFQNLRDDIGFSSVQLNGILPNLSLETLEKVFPLIKKMDIEKFDWSTLSKDQLEILCKHQTKNLPVKQLNEILPKLGLEALERIAPLIRSSSAHKLDLSSWSEHQLETLSKHHAGAIPENLLNKLFTKFSSEALENITASINEKVIMKLDWSKLDGFLDILIRQGFFMKSADPFCYNKIFNRFSAFPLEQKSKILSKMSLEDLEGILNVSYEYNSDNWSMFSEGELKMRIEELRMINDEVLKRKETQWMEKIQN